MKNFLEKVREQKPLVHCITNYVTVNDVANVLLACGASPIMADESQEVQDITSICNSLVLNIGTLNERTIQAMFLAGEKANALNHPIVLDPVGAGASNLRTKTAHNILNKICPLVVRGNASEIKSLSFLGGNSQGVDVSEIDKVTENNLQDSANFLRDFANKNGCIAVLTGQIDLVTDGKKCFAIKNGKPQMGLVTGTGCQLSALIAAFVAASKDAPLEATVAAVCMMGISGEIAWNKMESGDGNFSYRGKIIDSIFNMTDELFEKFAKYEEI